MNEETKEKTEPEKIMWCGYLHQNGSIQLKRWFGDVKDYTTDCEGNEFVSTVVKPFEAQDRTLAFRQILISLTDSPDPKEVAGKFDEGFNWLITEAQRADSYPGNKHARIMFLYAWFHREKFVEMLNIIRLQDLMLKTTMEKDLS